jgi:hypothetical protein
LKHDDYLTGVAVLVEITVPPMPTVKGNGITGENFPHQIPKGSITCADKQLLQPGKEKFFSSQPRKSFRSQSLRKISWRFKPLVMTPLIVPGTLSRLRRGMPS